MSAAPSPLDLLERYGISCRSVLHIGAHFAEEAELYFRNEIDKVTFVEGDPDTFSIMNERLRRYKNYEGVQALLSDIESTSKFFVASNGGESSSVLAPMRHLIEHPEISFDEVKELRTRTLDSLELGRFDLIVMDVQGNELQVIHGGVNTISNALALWVEVNAGSLYEGSADSAAVVQILAKNFIPVYMNMNSNKWGDALFINRALV